MNESIRLEIAEAMSSSTKNELPKMSCAMCKKKGVSLKCSGCGTVAYCNSDCQKSHWITHRPDCKLKKKERKREKVKEAARSSGSGSGPIDMGSIMAALMPPPQPQRYDEVDRWNACFHGHHDELRKMLKQIGLDVNWFDPANGVTAAYVSAQ